METETRTKPKRRMRTKAERRRVVEETLVAGASVARVARTHGVNANQVFNWRRLYRAGQLGAESCAPTLLPVKLTDTVEEAEPESGEAVQKTPSGVIDIELGHARVRIEGVADPACVRAALEGLRR